MNKTYTVDDTSLNCTIIRKKRKTLGIYIDVYGNIELRVPTATTDQAIDQLIMNKWDWIISRSDEMKDKTKGFKEKEYVDGETFLYGGRNYPIDIEVDETLKKAKVSFSGVRLTILTPSKDKDLLKKAMTRFYKQECKKLVEESIRCYQPNFKQKPKSIKIASNKKTWGTCNSLREMTFNWKLAMAPEEVMDYVVVHEMCHMLHMNHDRSFWRLVGKYIPDYEERQEWLRQSHWKMVV